MSKKATKEHPKQDVKDAKKLLEDKKKQAELQEIIKKGAMVKTDNGYFWPICDAYNVKPELLCVADNSTMYIPKQP